MATFQSVKDHLSGILHTGTLSKVYNIEHAMERASYNLLANIKPVDSERETSLTSLIYDDIYNYPLPSDFGWMIDLRPQGNRTSLEQASRRYAEPFDLQKALASRTVSIEGREGTKFIRINWRTRAPITIDDGNSLTANGTWATVAGASGLKLQTLYKITGNASIEFDIAATNDGVSFIKTSAIDLTDEDEIADEFFWLRIPTSAALANFNSATGRWGNDITANYWQSVAQTTQADGSAFKVGWNLLKFPWSTATETGTVAPATIDAFRVVFDIDAAITNMQIDSLVFAVGSDFDLKYYSAYGFKNTAGTYLIRPTSDDDEVIYSNTALEIFLEEARKQCAEQIEGEDSSFDIQTAQKRLWGDPSSPDSYGRLGLYAKYRAEYPAQTRRAVRSWASPRSGSFLRI